MIFRRVLIALDQTLNCSEMVADDLKANGWAVRFNEVPSPADLEQQILGRKNAIKE